MKTPVFATCADCGEQWSAMLVSEQGTDWLEPHHDQCPTCGSGAIGTVEMDETDVAEAKYGDHRDSVAQSWLGP